MKILFVHQNLPGQYKNLAKIYGANPENQVVFLTKRDKTKDIPGVTQIKYKIDREVLSETHRYLINFNRGILIGQEVWRALNKLKKEEGFTPDVICCHPGWGEGLFLQDVYKGVPLLNFQEFFYDPYGPEVNFDPHYPSDEDDFARIRIKNAINMYGIVHCDWAITPTFWQYKQFPKEFHSKMSVLHDGIDTDVVKPIDWQKGQSIKFKTATGNEVEVKQGDEIVTHVTRNFEPYRGFPTFAKMMEQILKKRPKAKFLIAGADGEGYGRTNSPKGKPYRHHILEQLDIDYDRVHFLGYMDYQKMLQLMQVSSAHVYLTVPFVLSWSVLEAMASGCLVVASNTQPVLEVIEEGKNGFLIDFFSAEECIEKVNYVLENQEKLKEVRKQARQTVLDKYSLNKVLPMHQSLINDLAAGKIPPPAANTIMQFNQSQGLIEKAA